MTLGLTTTNVKQGNTAQFIAEFIDANGNQTFPPGGTLTIVYPSGIATPGSTSVTIISAMTQINSFFTATWASSVSGLGLGTWAVAAPGMTSPAAQGRLRIIMP